MTGKDNVKEIEVSDSIDREDLFGTLDCNLRMIEEETGSEIIQRGSGLIIKGGDIELSSGIIHELSAMLPTPERAILRRDV